jgi:RHS repeat-associated protein
LGLANLNYLWTNVGVSQSYTVNGQNELTTVGSLNIGYDARGNLNSDGVNTYNYDLLNRLGSTGNGVSTLYDPEDRLISITSSGTATQFAYAGPNVAIEFNGATGQIYRRYVPGDSEDQPVVWFEGSDGSNPRWFLQDHQGSVVAVTDMTGGAISINTYDEYGTPALSNLGRYQFTGQFYLPEIGLYDYKARLYSPTKGRFMQTDPAGYQDGLNWYLYVHNDPVNGSDPSGDLAIETGCGAGDICTSTDPEASNAAAQRVDPNGRGPAGERAAGIQSGAKARIPSRTGTAAYRVPDASHPDRIEEVKNVKWFRVTDQIRDFVAEAKATARTFFLKLDSNARMNPASDAYIRENEIKVVRINMGSGSKLTLSVPESNGAPVARPAGAPEPAPTPEVTPPL